MNDTDFNMLSFFPFVSSKYSRSSHYFLSTIKITWNAKDETIAMDALLLKITGNIAGIS